MATPALLSCELLQALSPRIPTKVAGVVSIAYNIATNKPPHPWKWSSLIRRFLAVRPARYQ